VNITVVAYNPSGTVRAFFVTHSDGAFRLLVPSGDYKVGAFDPALLFATRFYVVEAAFANAATLHVIAPQTFANINLSLPLAGRITGHVRNASGAPLAGATVGVYTASGLLVASAETNAQGAYAIAVAPGTYTLIAFDRALRYVSSNGGALSVAAAQEQTRDFTLVAGAAVRALVRDLTTHAALGGIVFAAYDASGNEIATAVTDANGNAALALPPGTYRFGAADPLRHYATSFYANASGFEGATPLTLIAGALDVNLAFNLMLAPSAASGRHRAVRH
ncbi:MAG TPA: carboxypeptidase regulatory-like domain-containing protein, partial [Thermoanaerobaculia bacterium]|nr:carboxypeptidase regulatory-like domain-containing protein [Thermoanaerobaculia bacterium]